MPELSPDDQFQKVLTAADSQLKKNKILVRFGPAGKIRFVIDEASLKEELAGSDISETVFRETFDNEIGPLLETVIRGVVDQYVKEGSPLFADTRDPKVRAERQAIVRERANAIEKILVTPELRARYLVKVSSKHPRLRKYGWEVARKLELSTKEPGLQPYATLSFETLWPEGQLGIFSWFPFFPVESIGRSEHFAFDCDEGDLDDLIHFLEEAKATLRTARKGNLENG